MLCTLFLLPAPGFQRIYFLKCVTPDFISMFLGDSDILFPEICACLRGRGVVGTWNNMGEGSSVTVLFPIL